MSLALVFKEEIGKMLFIILQNTPNDGCAAFVYLRIKIFLWLNSYPELEVSKLKPKLG